MATRRSFPARPSSLTDVRTTVDGLLEAWPLAPRVDATLLANELAALRIAGEESPGSEISLLSLVRPASARFELRGGHPDPPGEIERRLLDVLATEWVHDGETTSFTTVSVVETAEDLHDADDETLFRLLPDRGARDVIFDRYHRFATGLARRFEGRRAARSDVDQVAGMALVKAIDRFDPDVGVKFTTFAGRTIVGELKRHLRDATWSIRVPRGLKEASLRLRRHETELTQRLGRQPTIAELAEAADLDVDDAIEALDAGTGYMSLSIDAPRGDEGETDLAATLGGVDSSLSLSEHWQSLAPLVSELPDRQQRILYLRFFEDMTQQEIADVVGVSQMHVSRLLARSLEHLRSGSRDGLTEPPAG